MTSSDTIVKNSSSTYSGPLTKRSRFGFVPTRREAIPVLLSALLFAVAFPPFKLIVPVFICLAPLAVFIAQTADTGASVRSAAKAGLWFGILAYGANLYWIAVALLLFTKLAILGYIGSLVWLSPFVAAAAAVLFYARRRTKLPMAILLPIVWVALEVTFNYLLDLSFPWLPLGLGVTQTPILAQLADLSGVRGVSFWIAAVNGLVADAWLLRIHRQDVIKRLLAIGVIFSGVITYGAWRMTSTPLTEVAHIGIVQPNIEEHEKLSITNPTLHVGTLTALTRDLLKDSAPDLVVWPEAALDRFLTYYPDWRDSLQAAVAERPTPLLTGVLDWEPDGPESFKYYNAAIVTNPYGWVLSGSYRKHYLVPIVERVPFLNPEWFKGMSYFGGYSRGNHSRPFPMHFGSVGVLICYESIFPQLARSYAQQGTTVLVNITNDAWFQRSTAPSQHFAHMTLRAIENRLPVVRSANTGISGYIDPLGRVRSSTPIFEQHTAVYNVESANVVTLYTRFGDWLGTLSIAATALLIISVALQWYRSRAQYRSQHPKNR